VYQAERQEFQDHPEAEGSSLDIGEQIIVRNRFLGDWTGGFRVAEVLSEGYRIQRISDGLTFPDVFPFAEVRQERRHGMRGSYLDRHS
jgi:hypothetical protein